MTKPRLFLLDANSFCYRAFFAIKANLSTSYGQPTGAVFGFINILNKILKENKPDYLSVCFDVSRDTFRKARFRDYKKGRPAMPDELASQVSIIKEIISAYNFNIFEKEGFEADDLIATIAEKAQKKFSVFIVSSDKDMLQLVNDNIKVYNPYYDEPIVDKHVVFRRFGVEPQHIVDIISLMGDSVDNIPGIKGIGEKTAVNLIKKYGNIDNLLLHLDQIMPMRLRNILKDQKDRLILSRELATLYINVPLDLDFTELKMGNPDYDNLYKLFKKLEFKSLLKDLPSEKCDSLQPGADICIKLNNESRIKDFICKLDNSGLMVFLLDITEDKNLRRIYFYCADKSYYIESEFYKMLKNVFLDEKIKKIGHNFKRAKVILAKYDIDIKGIYFDVMLAAYILNPALSSYELSDLISEYSKDIDEKNSFTIASTPLVVFIVRLKEVFEKELREKKQIGLFFEIEMPLMNVLADMEIAGVKIDLKILSSLSEESDKRISFLVKEIYRTSGKSFNINSPKQLRFILFEKLKLPIIKKTKTGASTNEEVLNKLAKAHHLPRLILDYRQLLKLKSTYIDPLPKLVGKDGRLHTYFNQTGTQTGRLSCSGPNLQNIPVKTEEGRRIRLAFIPESSDDLLLCCDYSQMELRILAHLSNDLSLISAFRDGKDVHRYTASLILRIDESKVDAAMRDMAKRVNFGIIYGMSSFGLSKDLNISNEEAQRFIEEYFLRYPGVKKYIEKTIEDARENGFVTTLLGRRRYLDRINSTNAQLRAFAERQAINAPIQGSASDMIKLAMVNIYNEIQKNAFKSKMILQIHDELIFDAKKKELPALSKLVKRYMENVLKLSVPIKVDIKAGKNWYKIESID